MAEKPGVLERLGVAMNSADLAPVEERIGAVELLGALAYTQTNPDATAHVELDAAVIDPRTELASVLVRLKYGGDRVLGERAVRLLVLWVHNQRAYRKWKLRAGDTTLERFVRQGLAEWLYPVCQVCQGRGVLGMDKGAAVSKRVRCKRCDGTGEVRLKSTNVRRTCAPCHGMGGMTVWRQIRGKPRECYSCMGTGARRPNDAERARVLHVEQRVYQRHWLRRFDWLGSGLDRLDRLEQHCLQSQLRSGTKGA